MESPQFQESHEPILTIRDEVDRHALLSRRINQLSLRIEGTRLEQLILQLYRELDEHGISFRPKCYLADEWGCPHNVPVIGIPFYLADPELSRLEGELTGVEAEDEDEILMYLRHEAGHAINYAYRLHAQREWRRLFGPYSRPYREAYRPNPFSDRYVRHIPGWYAQKHPDEDFAETFAVWLTPGANWEQRYANTGAYPKLRYVERAVRKYGRLPSLVTDDTLDAPVEELEQTLAEWYGTDDDVNRDGLALPHILNDDLRTLFPAREGTLASQTFSAQRTRLIRDVNYWTGINRPLLGALLDELIERTALLDLKIAPGREESALTAAAIFVTTLVMNYLYTGQFVKS